MGWILREFQYICPTSVFTKSIRTMKKILMLFGLFLIPVLGLSQSSHRDTTVFLKANTIELTSTFPEEELYKISQVYLIGQGYQLETNDTTQKILVGIQENEAISQKHKVRIQIKKARLLLQWEYPMAQSMGYSAIAYLPSSPLWPRFEEFADELKGYLTRSDKYYLCL